MESLLGCARCWLLVLLCWHIAALLLPHNMSNPNIQRLCCGQCHVVGQQRWLLHESAVLISMGMCIPGAEKKPRNPNPMTTLQEPWAAVSPWGEGRHCGHCDGCISILQGAGAPAIPTSSQPTAGCCQWSLGSRLLAGQSCAKQPLGAAARWKGAGSAGFPPARPAAKQQTQTPGSLGFSSCRGRQRFVQAINALGWVVSLQRYGSSLHVFPKPRKPEEWASPTFC